MKRLTFAFVSVGVAISALLACSSAGHPTATTPPAAGADASSPPGTADDASAPGSDATPPADAPVSAADAAPIDEDADTDGGISCEWGGAPGECISTTACAAIADHTSYADECPGPASIECCIVTPDTANNPPVPAGWQLMAQADVTTAMTDWAVTILNDPATYPMFSTTTMTFGALDVLARVEWHPPDFQNSVVHRGVTLYEPTD